LLAVTAGLLIVSFGVCGFVCKKGLATDVPADIPLPAASRSQAARPEDQERLREYAKKAKIEAIKK